MKRAIELTSDEVASCGATDVAHRRTAALDRVAASPRVLKRAAAMLRAAGDMARLQLLDLLAAGERCVTDIAAETGEPMPTVSHRLHVLRREGLLRTRRDGKHVYYAVADHHVLELIDTILRHADEPA